MLVILAIVFWIIQVFLGTIGMSVVLLLKDSIFLPYVSLLFKLFLRQIYKMARRITAEVLDYH